MCSHWAGGKSSREPAKFTLSPEFAHGDAGSPPKIPVRVTLVLEIELLSQTSKGHLFNDEGVVKSQVTKGNGWKTPKLGDEVLFSFWPSSLMAP